MPSAALSKSRLARLTMTKKSAHRSYWYRSDAPISIGCASCPERSECGGQKLLAGGFDCLDNCCRSPQSCDIVCPNGPDFVSRLREVGGLGLYGPHASPLPLDLHRYAPVLYNSTGRAVPFDAPAVVIKLYALMSRSGEPRFLSRHELCEAFQIKLETQIILTGVARDSEVEKWWGLEAGGRRAMIENFRDLGIEMITTPNFSLMLDRPRWDDLHAMKRILIAHHEFIAAGQPAALHVNSRCDRDFQRWADYVAAHDEVTHLAYEFATGPRHPERMIYHANGLCRIARRANRRIGLIIRGGSSLAPRLAEHFDVTIADTSLYEKSQHRRVCHLDEAGQRKWQFRQTPAGAPIDEIFAENLGISLRWARELIPERVLVD